VAHVHRSDANEGPDAREDSQQCAPSHCTPYRNWRVGGIGAALKRV